MDKKTKRLFVAACLLGAAAVIIGAFGAHGLEGKIPEASLQSYKTGVLYHFIHALAIFIALILYQFFPHRLFRIAALLFLIGILFFSGSIYLLSTRTLTNISFSHILGPITPLGGLLFILAWLTMAMAFLKNNK